MDDSASSDDSPAEHATRGDEELVRVYLQALRDQRPRRGRPKDPARIERQLRETDEAIEQADQASDPIRKLMLVQKRVELRAELEQVRRQSLPALAEDFVGIAGRYSARRGISWTAWRELGVPASVLERAGIRRDQ